MHGTGAPLVTPFDDTGAIDFESLSVLVDWVTDRGLDFLVPTGSTGEAEFLTMEERTAVVETVVDAAPQSVPVMAGTGHPGYQATAEQTKAAAGVGADAALTITPFYYQHDQKTLATYYRDLADESSIPIYLYSVPKFTDVVLEPETAIELASHENIAGMKDSSGNAEAIHRITAGTADEAFDLFVGAGSLYGSALDAGVAGGIFALANIAPGAASDVFNSHRDGNREVALERSRELIPLIRAVTAEFGTPALKAGMQYRGVPAGVPRKPLEPASEEAEAAVIELVDEILD